MTSLEIPLIVVLLGAGFGLWIIFHLIMWAETSEYKAYVRDWCLRRLKEDEIALTEAGIETMVNYLWNKMKDRSDMWDCELYISPSVYERIVNEYSRRKEW